MPWVEKQWTSNRGGGGWTNLAAIVPSQPLGQVWKNIDEGMDASLPTKQADYYTGNNETNQIRYFRLEGVDGTVPAASTIEKVKVAFHHSGSNAGLDPGLKLTLYKGFGTILDTVELNVDTGSLRVDEQYTFTGLSLTPAEADTLELFIEYIPDGAGKDDPAPYNPPA